MAGLSRLKDDISNKEIVRKSDCTTFRYVVTSKIYTLMEDEGVSKAELSKRLGISKPAVTTMLSGDRNLTIDKISDICGALGYTPDIVFHNNCDPSESEEVEYMEGHI